MSKGLDMYSKKRLHLLREETPGVLDASATPVIMTSLRVEKANTETRDKHRPQGSNADAWHALVMKAATLSGTIKPDYRQIDVLLEMLCGEPVDEDTATPGQVIKEYLLPESGARDIITYSGEWGVPKDCEPLLYIILQSLSFKATRGTQPSLDGNVSLLSLKPQPGGQNMTGGTDETQQIAITGGPTGGTFTLTVNVDGTSQTTAPIAYNATAAAVKAALEALTDIPADSIVAAGGPLPATPVTVAFDNSLGGTNIPQMTDNDASLTGGTTPAVAVTTTAPGVAPIFTLPEQKPMHPQHFSVRRAATFADVAGAAPIAKVHEINFSSEGLADAHMFFDEGDITSDSHVDGAEPMHKMSLALAYNTDPDSDCAKLTANANAEPSTPEVYEIRAAHPDGVHKFQIQMMQSVDDAIDLSAAGNVYQSVFPMSTIISDELAMPDGTPAMIRFITTTAV